MSNEKPTENMRDAAIRQAAEEELKRKTDPDDSHQRTIIVVGSKGVGKTSMIYRFLEKDEQPKATLAMDYSFGRKAGKSLLKDIVHVWEIGHLSSSLISAAMTGSALTHSPHHATILIMLDLTKPEILWASLEESLTVVRSAMKMSYSDQLIDEMRERRFSERKKNVDKLTDPFPMRMCIIGGKYDEFREFPSDKRELIGQCLRAAAHVLGATLQYHSTKDSQLVRRTKDLLSHYGFKAQASKGSCTDYGKALVVFAGYDSFSSIDLKILDEKSTMDTIKQYYVARIPQGAKEEETNLEDPANDPNFNEPIIDRLRTQRDEEISILLRDMLEGRTAKIPIPDPY